MVWFSCEDCGDSIKKPKLQAHMSQCSASRLTCIDCNVTFGRHDVNSHSKCVTEHEKYAQGLTKAPGFGGAQQMPSQESGAAKISAEDTSIPAGPPWRCRICNVSCTSRDTLVGHVGGAKHKRKAKAAAQAELPASDPQVEQARPATSSAQDVRDFQHQEGSAPKRQKVDQADVPLSNIEASCLGNGKATAQVANDIDGKQEALKVAAYNKKPIKWKKLASRELQGIQGMKMKTLLRKVLQSVGQAESKEARENFLRKLEKSSQFRIEGSHIRLSER